MTRRELIILLSLCSLTVAMVSRDRRAIYVNPKTSEATTTDGDIQIICRKDTVCEWSLYDPNTRRRKYNIPNSYCICDSQTDSCQEVQDDIANSAYKYFCRPYLGDTTTE